MKYILRLGGILIVTAIVSFAVSSLGRNSTRNDARENGMLRYKKALLEYSLTNNIYVDDEKIDSIYLSELGK